jgi:hypothetical protein
MALTVGCAHASVRHLTSGPPLAAPNPGSRQAPSAPRSGSRPATAKQPLTEPFAQVATGSVTALVPRKWEASTIESDGSLRQGLVASPNPRRWGQMDGTVPGLEVAWVDVTRVGIPSDLYYLAASGPAIPAMASSQGCRRQHHVVLLDHRPFAGDPFSPGDYVERGSGTCHRAGRDTRWAYFVAAPGFGPLRQMGIPTSGLYLAVAVVPQSPNAEKRLQTMLRSAQYGGASVAQLMRAARMSSQVA